MGCNRITELAEYPGGTEQQGNGANNSRNETGSVFLSGHHRANGLSCGLPNCSLELLFDLLAHRFVAEGQSSHAQGDPRSGPIEKMA